jgi:hypothetical protein
LHVRVHDAFAGAFSRTAPKGFHPFAGTTTAWEVARNAAILENVPYSETRLAADDAEALRALAAAGAS